MSKTRGPGETIWLEPHEVAHQRARGFVLDPANADDAQVIAAMFKSDPPTDAPVIVKALPEETTDIRFMRKA